MNTIDLQLDHVDERVWAALKSSMRNDLVGTVRMYKTTLLANPDPDAVRTIEAPTDFLGRQFVLSLEAATQIDMTLFQGAQNKSVSIFGQLLVLPGYLRSLTLTNLRQTTVEVSLMVVYGPNIEPTQLLLDGSWVLDGSFTLNG